MKMFITQWRHTIIYGSLCNVFYNETYGVKFWKKLPNIIVTIKNPEKYTASQYILQQDSHKLVS